ncbi:hypothetical protein SERLA73DRAFT_192131 [Serpula lacrymans var. lacrymans S7.3]|uniref:Uncharacterized protein n=1 Tax=Serpula lacrymans var. lacrymans (strain S7.3) TaxID=936435 RepID=F8QJ21_SERL3|nr:hypothetical protein SERLA73DRAFT_192131 [Serpula lacrymans var. lacrymans S7.3]
MMAPILSSVNDEALTLGNIYRMYIFRRKDRESGEAYISDLHLGASITVALSTRSSALI